MKQEAHLVALHKAGEHTSAELAGLFGVARSTVYRAIERWGRDAGTGTLTPPWADMLAGVRRIRHSATGRCRLRASEALLLGDLLQHLG
ncbi:MAG TPA: helix-turn-helix domain-containing protein [Nonomuraea sp.]|nr:helix-turn-helix domain-containing protein [Nonomuraea sp.]